MTQEQLRILNSIHSPAAAVAVRNRPLSLEGVIIILVSIVCRTVQSFTKDYNH